jgi:hypothetical protein
MPFHAPWMAHDRENQGQRKLAPNGPCLRRSPRPTGPRAMWVRRAVQRAEPQAPQIPGNKDPNNQYKGRRAGRLLGDF